jgi:phage/plasmid-associated DNA primase
MWKNAEFPMFENKSISAHNLYVIYKIWCESSGEKQYVSTETRFGTEAAKQLEKYRGNAGMTYKGAVSGLVSDEEISNFRKVTLSEKM